MRKANYMRIYRINGNVEPVVIHSVVMSDLKAFVKSVMRVNPTIR